MPRFRKKPIEVEAVKFTGRNDEEVLSFCDGAADDPLADRPTIVIHTREGDMTAEVGDWIIKEPRPTADRRFYPCKPDIFEATYESVS